MCYGNPGNRPWSDCIRSPIQSCQGVAARQSCPGITVDSFCAAPALSGTSSASCKSKASACIQRGRRPTLYAGSVRGGQTGTDAFEARPPISQGAGCRRPRRARLRTHAITYARACFGGGTSLSIVIHDPQDFSAYSDHTLRHCVCAASANGSVGGRHSHGRGFVPAAALQVYCAARKKRAGVGG